LARRLAIAGLKFTAAMMTRTGIVAQLPALRRGQRPGATIKYPWRTTSATARKFLGTTINKNSPVTQNYNRRGQRPEHQDYLPVGNNELRRGHWPWHHGQVPATHNGRRRGQRLGYHAQLPARRRGQRPGATIK
jgi:hypothetical protein